MPTEKRQRQKEGRRARLEAQQKAQKRKRSIRRVITIVVVLAFVVGISYLIFKPSTSKSNSAASTTTPSTTSPVPPGGSGDRSPSAITTSADCPSNFRATLNKPSYPSFPPMTIDTSKNYTATITTDVGTITVQLYAKQAPKAVNSFVFLAKRHFFDCIIFHRVIQTFMDQTGDPTGTGTGGPGYQFSEPGPKPASPQYPLGSLAMANSNNPATTDPTTNGSQFFNIAGPEGTSLAPDYTLFGRVTSGMSVVEKINSDGAPASNQTGSPTVLHRMISVTINES